jgi:hypothetical protein
MGGTHRHYVAICANHGEVFQGYALTFLRCPAEWFFVMNLSVPGEQRHYLEGPVEVTLTLQHNTLKGLHETWNVTYRISRYRLTIRTHPINSYKYY